jgi:hypothetical protein
VGDLRRYQRIPQAQLEKMWAVYRETGTIKSVCKATGAHAETVRRWRDREGWDARREALLRKSRDRSDARYSAWLEEQRTVVDHLIERAKRRLLPEPVRDGLGEEIDAPMDIGVQDLIALVKFGLFLRGGPETRQETVVGTGADGGSEDGAIAQKALDELDDATKKKILRAIRAGHKEAADRNDNGSGRKTRASRHHGAGAPEGRSQ